MTAAVKRVKASTRNIQKGVYLTDGTLLYEVRGVRGVKTLRAGTHNIPLLEAVKLADCSADLPDSEWEEDQEGAWCPIAEVIVFEVVVPDTSG